MKSKWMRITKDAAPERFSSLNVCCWLRWLDMNEWGGAAAGSLTSLRHNRRIGSTVSQLGMNPTLSYCSG